MNAEIQTLFNNRTFQQDLPTIARLPKSVFDAIVESFRTTGASGDVLFSPANINRVVAATGQDREAVVNAFTFSSFVATQLSQGEVTPAEVAALIQKPLSDPALATPLIQHVRDLATVAGEVRSAIKRRQAVVRASRTLTDIEFSCGLRIGTQTDEDQTVADIGDYAPKVSELIPIVNLELSYRDAVQDRSCLFQLTTADVKQLILALQMAEKQINAATGAVSLARDGRTT